MIKKFDVFLMTIITLRGDIWDHLQIRNIPHICSGYSKLISTNIASQHAIHKSGTYIYWYIHICSSWIDQAINKFKHRLLDYRYKIQSLKLTQNTLKSPNN